ncbi:DsbA family protein [Streptomyces sp. MCA2]|uniref:mycothiol-dependent nitroreductase Rv2466c family protein n=1 Tax=Streptomyces sp. MCA2 TaxID=2944805 RepID=UPI00202044BB|nr:DsbA family protein [Streptomyces sp. MCA2]MCL7492445.1 DsbA family protein [Streptomyces sp. MCA2]
MSETAKTPADFWFDPLCPWAWLTSRWMLEVEKVRPVEVRWHVMSLAVLNEDKLDELPEEYRENMRPGGKAWGPVRVVIAAQQLHGDEAVGKLYTALGTRIHNEGLGVNPESIAAALEDAGLPADLIEYADKDTYDTELRASHKEGIDLVGQEVGTPVIAVPGPDSHGASAASSNGGGGRATGGQIAFFGPVVTPAPKGEEAAKLWDGTLMVASIPGFYEIKRTRTQGPVFD